MEVFGPAAQERSPSGEIDVRVIILTVVGKPWVRAQREKSED